jgi:hypothetical protein
MNELPESIPFQLLFSFRSLPLFVLHRGFTTYPHAYRFYRVYAGHNSDVRLSILATTSPPVYIAADGNSENPIGAVNAINNLNDVTITNANLFASEMVAFRTYENP